VADWIRTHWDFNDLAGSEARFKGLLAAEKDDALRAELLTQLARVEGLRGSFDTGERLIEEAEALAGNSDAAAVRIDLERGRLRRSGGDPAAALPLFESAFARASEAREQFLAADAAHMAALAAPDEAGIVDWTDRGIEVAESDESARYWLGPLLNNLGWEHYEHGRYEQALDAFERALAERERDPENTEAIELARYATAKALRSLDRSSEAVAHAEHAVASAEAEGRPDAWYHEELAETYAALERHTDAAIHARRAFALLTETDPSFDPEGDRAARLHELADPHH
jgi:tetratricopeptide (TPR) repeat protein